MKCEAQKCRIPLLRAEECSIVRKRELNKSTATAMSSYAMGIPVRVIEAALGKHMDKANRPRTNNTN